MVNNSRRPSSGSAPGLKKPLIYSVAFHGALVLLAIFGLPHIVKEREVIESVPVELVTNISEITTTNKPPVKTPPKEDPKPEPPKPAEKKPPPTPTPPPPPEEALEEPPKPDVKPEPTTAEIAEKLIKKPPEKKPEKPKPVKKPEKPKPKKEEPKKDTQQDDFDKLLNTQLEADPPQPETPPNEQPNNNTPEPSPNVSRFSDVLSMSERDALIQQLSGCWSVISSMGSSNAGELAVEVRVTMNPDRTVRTAQIVNMSRYNSDTFFRSAADAALRALKNPRCNPLILPPDKYSQWQNMVINFDPKDMF